MTALQSVDASSIDAALEILERDGAVIVQGVANAETCEALRAELRPKLDRAEAGFEAVSGGAGTKRIGRLVKASPTFRAILQHPVLLATAARHLGGTDGFQFCGAQGIEVGPGANAQEIHTDEDLFEFPHPSPVLVVSMLAVDPFTADNGATLVIPGSHRWPRDRKPTDADAGAIVKAVMPAGSLCIVLGSTWHAGGANRTSKPRLGIRISYNPYWMRQEENQAVAIPAALVETFDSELRGLLGFRMHYGLGVVQRDESDDDDPMARLYMVQEPPAWVLEALAAQRARSTSDETHARKEEDR